MVSVQNAAQPPKGRLGFGIDRGGTFTDVFVAYPDGRTGTFKLLSVDRQNYSDAPTEAIRRVLSDFIGIELTRGEPIPTGEKLMNECFGWTLIRSVRSHCVDSNGHDGGHKRTFGAKGRTNGTAGHQGVQSLFWRQKEAQTMAPIPSPPPKKL